MHLVNSVYGFEDALEEDDDGEVEETVQKDHRTLNRLKHDVDAFMEKTENNIIDLRSMLIINNALISENAIVVEASAWTSLNNLAPGPVKPLFNVFDRIKKVNGDLFHFGECTKIAHNNKDKVVDLLRDSNIYVSFYLRVQLAVLGKMENVMFYLAKITTSSLRTQCSRLMLLPVLVE